MLLIASIILESSPPEATFDNDLGGSPGFAEIINSILSKPVDDKLPLSKLTKNCILGISRNKSSFFTFFSKSDATFFLSLESFSARLTVSFNNPSYSLLSLSSSSSAKRIEFLFCLAFSRKASISSSFFPYLLENL